MNTKSALIYNNFKNTCINDDVIHVFQWKQNNGYMLMRYIMVCMCKIGVKY